MDNKQNAATTAYKPLEWQEAGSGKLQAPGYQPQAPGLQPPAYQPQALAYPQPPPAFEPQAPGFQPQALGYPQQAPGFQSQGPAYQPQAMGYPQQTPGFQPQAPGFQPQAPEYKPQAPGYYPQPQMPQGQQNEMTDVLVHQPDPFLGTDDDGVFGSSFGNKSVRAAFVRKVYMILLVQLLTTIGIIALFIFHEGIKYQVTHSLPLYLSAYVIFLVTYFSLSCCTKIRRQHPYNLILLVIFTLAMAYMAGVISAFYNIVDVFMAIGITAVVCLGISLFAIQTKWDITGWGLYLFVASLVLLLFGIISIFVAVYAGSRIMNVVYAGLVALLFSLYLVYDTQQIVGGRKIELSPEEYIYGALQLYVDMMEIFLAILRLVGRK